MVPARQLVTNDRSLHRLLLCYYHTDELDAGGGWGYEPGVGRGHISNFLYSRLHGNFLNPGVKGGETMLQPCLNSFM